MRLIYTAMLMPILAAGCAAVAPVQGAPTPRPTAATRNAQVPPKKPEAEMDYLTNMLSGNSSMQGAALDRAITAAEAFPLGGTQNPIRVEMPEGQHRYLRALRCSNGRPPQFHRIGNVGAGVYDNIVDLYQLDCGNAAPGQVRVYMDMYHHGHIEVRPVPGFSIVDQ